MTHPHLEQPPDIYDDYGIDNDPAPRKQPSRAKGAPDPFSIEAEQSVLGALLIDPDAMDLIAPVLTENDFFEERHRTLFGMLVAMTGEGRPIDAVTVSEALQDHGTLKEVGGVQYLLMLANETPSSVNAVAYARIVRDRAALRALTQAGRDILDLAGNPEGRNAKELFYEAENLLAALSEEQDRSDDHCIVIRDAIVKAVDEIEAAGRNKSETTGLATGFTDLDVMTTGLHPGQLIIAAGRPGMGKTAFAMNIAENVVTHNDKSVLVFSMEMPTSELALRVIASQGQVHLSRLRSGNVTPSDWGRMAHVIGAISASKLFIDDSSALSVGDVRARAKRIQREYGLDMVVIDYLQLMQAGNNTGNRVAEISEISRSLKSLAKDLNVPVIALSQLNRGLENRTDKRPMMSDLRESGAIEQDADLILFLYRDEVYNKDKEELKGLAEIVVGKQRNGPTGTVMLKFSGEYSLFSNGEGTGDAYGNFY